MKFDNFLDKKVKITQVKGGSKATAKVKGNLIGLGLRGIGSSVEVTATSAILGMIKKAGHLLRIN
jgi:ribosomal protein L30